MRINSNEFTVIGVAGKRPSPGGFNVGPRMVQALKGIPGVQRVEEV